jgi:NAD(P)H-hydrate epimerase
MQSELSSSHCEIIKEAYHYDHVTEIANSLNEATAIFIGPGIGRSTETRRLLQQILPKLRRPCVIDGDALTLIAEEEWPLPPQAVLTPHKGEMLRLLKRNTASLDREFLNLCQTYAEQNHVTLILKGGPSFIFCEGKPCAVNPLGDPGMATAGSGDVLTGLIAALLAQGLPSHHAACLGVTVHGLAGEFAAKEKTSYCLTAADIIEYFPHAFKFLA